MFLMANFFFVRQTNREIDVFQEVEEKLPRLRQGAIAGTEQNYRRHRLNMMEGQRGRAGAH